MKTRGGALSADDELALQHILAATIRKLDLASIGEEALELVRQVARRLLAERMTAHTAELRLMNERLAGAMQAKDAFLAGISHELRTPLNAILGVADLLGDGYYGPISQRQRRPLETIRSNGNLLLGLINDILDLAKIEAGCEELVLALVYPAEVCATALGLVGEGAQAKGITLEQRIAPDAPPLMADVRRLTQILVNLLSNALKFTPSGGIVGLELAVEADGAALRFTVWDSGVGIAPYQQRRLFHAFSQAEGEPGRRPAGSGLGLALVARLVRLHGGSVTLESQPGAGCRLSVTLPCAPEAAATAEPAPNPAHPTILVIDEHELTAQALAGQFRARGVGCLAVAGDAEVSALARLLTLGAVFAALPMNDHQGEALLPRLRATLPPATRLIAIGTVLLADSAARALAAGADAYLPRHMLPGAAMALLG